jgi:hypothetical protein
MDCQVNAVLQIRGCDDDEILHHSLGILHTRFYVIKVYQTEISNQILCTLYDAHETVFGHLFVDCVSFTRRMDCSEKGFVTYFRVIKTWDHVIQTRDIESPQEINFLQNMISYGSPPVEWILR